MVDILVSLFIVVVVSAIAGGVAAFTHYALLSNLLKSVHTDIAKLEALKKAL